jgi:hypothetical protein
MRRREFCQAGTKVSEGTTTYTTGNAASDTEIQQFYKFDVHGTMHRYCIPLSVTNKMQRYTIFFIAVNALYVSGGFSANQQELKTVHTASGICQTCLLLPLAWVSWHCQLTQSSCWLYLKELKEQFYNISCHNNISINQHFSRKTDLVKFFDFPGMTF